MAWITITSDDVKRRLAAPEYARLGNAAKQVDQDAETVVALAIAETVQRVRGYVAGCTRNVLGDGQTVPDELKSSTLALIRDYLFTRLPGMKGLNDELRQQETQRAMTELRDVAACKMAIVSPEAPADDQAAGAAIQIVSSKDRQRTPEKLDGLF